MVSDDELVAFLLEETGETLTLVVEYDAEEWRFLHVQGVVREQLDDWKTQADEIIEGFRQDARRNAAREQLFDVGSFYCSLHLFDSLLLIHFSQPDDRGLILGYEPAAASNLTAFVEMCLPHIREYALSDVGGQPTWKD